MAYADLPGVHLWYTDSGKHGIPVIFLHPATGTSESWVQQVPDFAAAGYRCIAYDRRGSGRSTPDPTGEQPGHSSDDLHQLVVYLALERFHLVATAAGNAVALDYALGHRDRVRSLVLAGGAAGYSAPAYVAALERIHPPEYRSLPAVLREVGASYRALNPEGTQRWVELERRSRRGDAQPQGRRHKVTSELLQTLGVPTLLLAGEADLSMPPALMRMLAGQIPGSVYSALPEAGHAAFWEQPDVWNSSVLAFLSHHGG